MDGTVQRENPQGPAKQRINNVSSGWLKRAPRTGLNRTHHSARIHPHSFPKALCSNSSQHGSCSNTANILYGQMTQVLAPGVAKTKQNTGIKGWGDLGGGGGRHKDRRTKYKGRQNSSSFVENYQIRKYSGEGGMEKIKRQRKPIGQILWPTRSFLTGIFVFIILIINSHST